ncbi:hypothetical protein ACQKIE_12045 [Luteibacter sp. NPDC031894]|uniref:hypothetical protein n=1 Tax=Luteibacter sp. NPDC031894 TaxID=3390572 RepID=UPI003D0454A6
MEKPEPRVQLPSRRIVKTEVQLVHTRLYSNDRQQIRLGLYMEAEEGGLPVELTEEELGTLRIIDYDDDRNTVPMSDDGPAHYHGWSSQREHRGYDYYQGPGRSRLKKGSTASGRRARAGRTQYLYLSARNEARTFPLRPAFSIVIKNATFITTGAYLDATGNRERYPEIDSYGHEVLEAEAPKIYSAGDFTLDQDTYTPAIFDREVRLMLRPNGGNTLGIRHLVCEPAGMIHWEHTLPGNSVAYFTGYARPGETALEWHPGIHPGSTPRPEHISGPVQDIGTIMVCGRNDLMFNGLAPRGPILVRVIDAYGSDQTCRVSFVPGVDKDAQLVTS